MACELLPSAASRAPGLLNPCPPLHHPCRFRELRDRKLAQAAAACEQLLSAAGVRLAALARAEGATLAAVQAEAARFEQEYRASTAAAGPTKFARLAGAARAGRLCVCVGGGGAGWGTWRAGAGLLGLACRSSAAPAHGALPAPTQLLPPARPCTPLHTLAHPSAPPPFATPHQSS